MKTARLILGLFLLTAMLASLRSAVFTTEEECGMELAQKTSTENEEGEGKSGENEKSGGDYLLAFMENLVGPRKAAHIIHAEFLSNRHAVPAAMRFSPPPERS